MDDAADNAALFSPAPSAKADKLASALRRNLQRRKSAKAAIPSAERTEQA